jgi:hypothetical protein
MTRYETCVVVCGHTPIMMHPRLPAVPLMRPRSCGGVMSEKRTGVSDCGY